MLDKEQILTFDYPYQGVPFVRWLGTDLDTLTLDYSFQGSPYNSGLDEAFVLVELKGTMAASASISGNLRETVGISGTIAGVSSITGDTGLVTYAILSGTISAVSEMEDADLGLFSELSGSIGAVSDISGNTRLVVGLGGDITGVSLIDGILRFNWDVFEPSPWNDWDDHEGETDEVWILRTDAADNSWDERTDEADDVWILRGDTADNTWTQRT